MSKLILLDIVCCILAGFPSLLLLSYSLCLYFLFYCHNVVSLLRQFSDVTPRDQHYYDINIYNEYESENLKYLAKYIHIMIIWYIFIQARYFNPIKPKLFWGLPGPGGGGGGGGGEGPPSRISIFFGRLLWNLVQMLCPPPPEFLYFSADCYEIWYRCKTSQN